jgi:hypothetical protein
MTGNDCVIIIMLSLREITGSPTYTASWDGNAMTLQRNEFGAMGGFGKGAAVIWTYTAGNFSNKTASGSVTISGADSSTQWMFTLLCMTGAHQSSLVQSVAGSFFASAGSSSSLTAPAAAEGAVDVISIATAGSVTISGTGHTQLWNFNNSGTGRDQLSHASGYLVDPNTQCAWSFSGSYAHAQVCLNESVANPPVITSVDGDNSIITTQTNIAIVGTSLSGGVTALFYADGTNYSTATKVQQTISGVSGTTITWSSVNFGSITGAGTRYLFAVTDYGGGGQQVSAAFAITVSVPPAPAITSLTGGSTVDTTDTNRVVNGTNFVSVGTTALFLAQTNVYAAATKVQQTITGTANTVTTWSSVNMGSLTVGSMFLFVVSDFGGANATPSAAFPITMTTPITPTLTSVAGGRTRFYPNETNLAVVGTDLAPGGTTKLVWADSSNYTSAVKQDQAISSVTSTSLNWNAINLGSIGEGFFYLFAVTWAGDVKERRSVPLQITIQTAVPAVITSVAGMSTITDTMTNATVYGNGFSQPGTTQLWYASTSTFATATKVQQSISAITDTSMLWASLNQGAVGVGAKFLFVVTDAGGPNEQISSAFSLMVTTTEDNFFVVFQGDDDAGIFTSVYDSTVITPPTSILLLRDWMCWTGVGTWYYARDLFKDPSSTSDIVILGDYAGPVTGSKAVQIETVTASGTWRIRANESINIFTEASRYKFCVGFWLYNQGGGGDPALTEVSFYKIQTSTGSAYVEVFLRRVSGKIRLGAAYYSAGVRYEYVAPVDLQDVVGIGGWVFLVCKIVYDANPRIVLNIHGDERTSNVGTSPTGALYELVYMINNYTSTGTTIGVRFFGLFYGMANLSAANITTLRNSASIAAYQSNLRSVFGTAGPVHYFPTNDTVPDRFIHDHSGNFHPAKAVGGAFQRGIVVGTYGGSTMYIMRFTGGCRGEAAVEVSFSDYGCTIVAHIRYVGPYNQQGTMLLLQASNGAKIELYKTSAGIGPNETNGRLRVIVKSSTSTTIVDDTISSPVADPFDGLVHTYVLSTGTSNTHWKLTQNGYAVWSTSLGSIPAWHGNSYTTFIMAGIDMDCHSVGYRNSYDANAHSQWHVWSSVYDLLQFMQNNSYNAAYWNQNVRAND